MSTTVREFAERRGSMATQLRGLARRVLLRTLNSSFLAQVVGYTGAYGEVETPDGVEAFPGIGFYSIPSTSGAPEAIVIHVGAASSHPVIVAMRDAKTARPASLVADESMIYNSVAFIRIDKNGKITIRAKAGATVEVDDGSGSQSLATKADVDALAAYIDKQFDPTLGHKHAVAGAATTTITEGTAATGPTTVPAAAGTSVLKGK